MDYMIPNDYLVHHGILGMRWGVRRYKNKDGTLTAAGRKRYGYEFNPSTTYKSTKELDNAAKIYKNELNKTLDIGDGIKAKYATTALPSVTTNPYPFLMSSSIISRVGYPSFHWSLFPEARMIPLAASSTGIIEGMSSILAFLTTLKGIKQFLC